MLRLLLLTNSILLHHLLLLELLLDCLLLCLQLDVLLHGLLDGLLLVLLLGLLLGEHSHLLLKLLHLLELLDLLLVSCQLLLVQLVLQHGWIQLLLLLRLLVKLLLLWLLLWLAILLLLLLLLLLLQTVCFHVIESLRRDLVPHKLWVGKQVLEKSGIVHLIEGQLKLLCLHLLAICIELLRLLLSELLLPEVALMSTHLIEHLLATRLALCLRLLSKVLVLTECLA